MSQFSAVIAFAFVLIIPRVMPAQSPVSASTLGSAGDSTCTYATCALSIVPQWNGLAVATGAHGPRVANLNFFWPQSVANVLRGGTMHGPAADSAAALADQASGLRRVGAALTDAGLLAAGVALVRIVKHGRISTADKLAGGGAVAALLVSVPFQFAADGALSRAVWWHNVRYAR